MRRLLAIALIFSCGTVRAASPEIEAADPAVRADANKHFGNGSSLYNEGRYAEAVGEFERAKTILPAPELDYNIAKSLDRLGRWEAAMQSYKLYVSQAPNVSNLDEVRARILELEQRTRTPKVLMEPSFEQLALKPMPPALMEIAIPPFTSRVHRYLAAEVTGGAALALGIVGASLLGSAVHDYKAYSSPPTSFGSIPSRAYAGDALLGIAGAAVVADVVLWVVAARRHR